MQPRREENRQPDVFCSLVIIPSYVCRQKPCPMALITPSLGTLKTLEHQHPF